MIHSLQNPRIKQAIRLRDRRGREQQSRIIIDGWRETCRALEGNIEPLELFVCEALLDAVQWNQLVAQAAARGVKPTLVTREVFQKLAFGDRGEGVVLVAALPHTSLEQLPFSAQAVIGVLEHVEKPGNLGAIVRTADAAGVSAVVVADGGTDLYNPNAIRASLAQSSACRSPPQVPAMYGAGWSRTARMFSRRAWMPACSTPRWNIADRVRLSWAANRTGCRRLGREHRFKRSPCRCSGSSTA